MVPTIHSLRYWGMLSVLIFLIGACATSKTVVRSDYDHKVDFSQYHSFGFFEKLATDERYESLTTEYIKTAVIQEMKSRGYHFVEQNPDLLVNFNIKLKEKQKVQSAPYAAGYYGYRWGYYGAWGGYNYNTYTYEYTQGTMNIDLVDRARKQMVWEGVAIGRVSEEDFANMEQTISKHVHEIFKKFPFSVNSGSAAP